MASKKIVILVFALLLLVACSRTDYGSVPTVKATISLNPKPNSDSISAVTPTPKPTRTPEPTPTSTPTPTPKTTPTFSPGSVILPTPVFSTPTYVPETHQDIGRQMDALELKVSLFRGLSPSVTAIRTLVSREEMKRWVLEKMDEDREKIETEGRLYQVLGVLSQNQDLYEMQLALLTEGVLGVYDDDSGELLVVEDEDREQFSIAEQLVYVHEYVHFLQDENYDLHASLENLDDKYDEGLAFLALVEGDATVTEYLYMMNKFGDESIIYGQTEPSAALLAVLAETPGIVRRILSFPYQEGREFVATIMSTHGWQGVNSVYSHPPKSTEHILHPDRYLRGDAPQDVTLPSVVDILGEGWEAGIEGTLGEFFLRAYMLEMGFGTVFATTAAEGWGGDKFEFVTQDDGSSVLVLSTLWDTQQDATEFYDAFFDSLTHREDYIIETEENEFLRTGKVVLPKQVVSILGVQQVVIIIFAPDDRVMDIVRSGVLGG